MIAWISVLALSVLVGQDPGATLTGVVRDARTGGAVAGASVLLADLGRATTSGASGRYRLPRVPAGLQHLEVRRIGYEPRALHAFVPATGEVEIHLSLRPDPVRLEGVGVLPPVAIRGADAPAVRERGPGVSLSGVAIANHPMLAEPDAFGALAGGVVAAEPEAPHGLHVRGGRADQVTYLLDGIPVLNPYHSVGLFSAWNPDALLRLRLEERPPSGAAPGALSGVVAAETRRPGAVHAARGAASTSQLRATVDGPIAPIGGGYLVSLRRGFAGVPAPESEPSYVQGWSGDWLAKVEAAVGGGTLRLLGYGNRNHTAAASRVMEEGAMDAAAPGHRFGWDGRSVGGEWSRSTAGADRLRVRGWHATADAAIRWVGGEPEPFRVESARDDAGAAASLDIGEGPVATSLGLRASRSRTRYRVSGAADRPELHAVTTTVAASAEHARDVSRALRVEVGGIATLDGERARLSPHAEVRWSPRDAVRVALSVARTHQAEQSLLNDESLATLLFPAALSLGAGAAGVPVARSDRVSVVLDARAAPGTRVAAELYARTFRDLVLVAPVTDRPFATDTFAVGSGRAAGAALEFSMAGARSALLATYAVEAVRYAVGDHAYRPTFAPRQRLEVGMLAFPWTTLSVRTGLTAAFGRRATAQEGPFEWEACNVVDRGCEFAGRPERRAEPLGATRLPPYLRLDVGARKHWHLKVRDAEAQVGLYASVTNLLGRRNLLTRTLDPLSGDGSWIEMRSRVPVVVGADWHF